MNDFTTLELVMISTSIEFALEDKSAERAKHILKSIDRKVTDELHRRGFQEYLTACDQIVAIDSEFAPFAEGMKKVFKSLQDLKESMK